jgi:hypothetical protein
LWQSFDVAPGCDRGHPNERKKPIFHLILQGMIIAKFPFIHLILLI